MKQLQNIAIFISGKGSNAKNLISYFANHSFIKINLVISDKENSEIQAFCENELVDFCTLFKEDIFNGDHLIEKTKKYQISWVVLAGFLKKIPEKFINNYPMRIFNLHPSLLPKYGGKGMYGDFVHKAVLENGEAKSGITIHLVNEEYDKGEIIAQYEVIIDLNETIESLSCKIKNLEHTNFPITIENYIENYYQE